jgi:hypothetical protein
LFVFALLALAILATPAFAGSADPTLCLQTQYNQVQKQKLNCTANDVRVASVSNVTDLAGNTIATCIEGTTFSFIANFNVVTTANATNAGGRDNIGLYFQTDPSKANALVGNTCTDNIISQQHPCATSGSGSGTTCGTTGYQEFDTAPDNCGDTSSSVNGNIGDIILVKDFKCTTSNSVPCPFDSTKQCLSLPNCTSWQVPGSSIQCVASTPTSTPPGNWDYPFDASGNPEAIPGSPSKCNCGIVALPVQPVNPKPLALKACNTPLTSTAPTFNFDTNNPPGTVTPSADTNCDAGVEGQGTATYTVAVDNPNVSGAFGNIIIDQICDSAYGQIYPATGSCAAGSVGTGTFVSCSTFDVALGAFATCTFTAPSIGELNSVNNIVTVSGHSKVSTGVTFSTQTNQVTVHSEDAPTTAAVAKSFQATIAACATVRYNVDVHNTSGFDEVETLSALSDTPFGSLTSVHDDVKGTTCGVANGAGTLSGTAGAGTLPATVAVDGHYTCQFDGQFCSAVDGSTCIQHDNQITTVTLIGDAGESHTSFNQASNTLTVKECLQASTP